MVLYMKFIIFGVDELSRIAVIDGRPYYQSTGINSKMPGIWLPFFGVNNRNKPINITKLTQNQRFTREYAIAGIHGHNDDALIKAVLADAVPVNPPQWCKLSYQIKTQDQKIEKGTKSVQLFDRLFLKVDLINSLRLTDAPKYGCDTAAIVKDAGLTATETQLANNKIILDEKPVMITTDSQSVNEWLIQQGVNLKYYPKSYRDIWDSNKIHPQAEEKLNFESTRELGNTQISERELKQAKALLLDYTKNDSAIKRFFTAHWNRKHIAVVTAALDNKKLDTVNKLVAHIRYTIGDGLDIHGSLARRLDFIENQTLNSKAKTADACALLWQWQVDHGLQSGLKQYVEHQKFLTSLSSP